MHNPGRGMGRQAGGMEAQAGGMGAQAGGMGAQAGGMGAQASGYYQQPPQAQVSGSNGGSGSGSQHHRMQSETIRFPAMVDCHVCSLGG